MAEEYSSAQWRHFLTRFLGTLLHNGSPHDLLVFGPALAIMRGVALSAAVVPAWRASRTDPARVLRDWFGAGSTYCWG